MNFNEYFTFIDEFEFHPAILERFVKETNEKFNISICSYDIPDIVFALKSFFKCSIKYNNEYPIVMPSSIVDELWHVFLLYTKEYYNFCANLGFFIHHSPDNLKEWRLPDVLKQKSNDQKLTNLINSYQLLCNIEGLDPLKDISPSIFNIDIKYSFENKQKYDIIYFQNLIKENHKLNIFQSQGA